MRRSLREKSLIAGFGAFLLLTVIIGLIGILQIYSLSKVIKKLGEDLLPRERVILKMKADNALYAIGVRNYIFWRTSKYLEAASFAPSLGTINRSFSRFKENIVSYASSSVSEEQRQWAKKIEILGNELERIGGRLVALADYRGQDKDEINKLLVSFENKFYSIDGFLTDILSRSNLKDIERQLELAARQKNISTSILTLSLLLSLGLGLLVSFIVYGRLENERRKREVLVQRMIRVEEEERKNLSRQIHDQLSQDLGALKIYLELIESSLPCGEDEQKKRLDKSREILANLIDRGHNISELLRPPELDDLGLVECIDALVSRHREITGASYNYYRPDANAKFSGEDSLVLYRVVQEALTNIIKYAKAKKVDISLQKKGNTINLIVSDNGVGFDYEAYLKQPRRRKEDKLRLGLQGLRERIELLGGELAVQSRPGAGTKIVVRLGS